MCRTLRNKLQRTAGGERRLVAVDIENVVGGAVHTVDEATWAMRQVNHTIGVHPSDHVVIGVSHIGALAADIGWKEAHPRLVVRSGPDGADLALLDVLESEHVSERYDELVLISGDWIFADVVARLQVSGLRIEVVAHRGGLSRKLQAAAGHVTFLTDHDRLFDDAA